MPAVLGMETVSSEEFLRWHVERSLHAMGAATDTDLSRYLTFPKFALGARRAAIRAMLERGEVTELQVEGSTARWLALTRDLPLLARARRAESASRGTTLLSPFDSLLWYRERVARLFRFDYRIEVYTPGPQRVHGYYTLPILHHGQLIGRIDAKTHRTERRLEVRHVHFEPGFAAGTPPPGFATLEHDEALAGVVDALRSLAAFVGADTVFVRRATPHRLRTALARALRAAANDPETDMGGGADRRITRRSDPPAPARHVESPARAPSPSSD